MWGKIGNDPDAGSTGKYEERSSRTPRSQADGEKVNPDAAQMEVSGPAVCSVESAVHAQVCVHGPPHSIERDSSKCQRRRVLLDCEAGEVVRAPILRAEWQQGQTEQESEIRYLQLEPASRTRRIRCW